MNDAEELIFHRGYKMSGPERQVGAERRQHMRLQVLLINHETREWWWGGGGREGDPYPSVVYL